MKVNYLTQHLVNFYQKIEYDRGYLFHIESDLHHFYKNEVPKIQTSLGNKIGEDTDQAVLKFSGIAISDISGPTDNGALYYYPLPTDPYIVKFKTYEDQMNRVFVYVRNLLLSQSYDALETYMKDITIEYSNNNESLVLPYITNDFIKKSKDKIDWEETINGIKSKRNNDILLDLIRSTNLLFKKVELSNTKKIDLILWYKMFATIRHCIVHSRSVLSKDRFNGLNKEGQDYLNDFINFKKESDGSIILFPSREQVYTMIKIVCEYAFQIFKGFSENCGLEWRILLHMPK